MKTLCKAVLDAMGDKTLATAESCTGGMIGSFLTAVPGSSRVYRGGIISYTNRVKEDLLGVPVAILDAFGAVSEQVAMAMAQGALSRLHADVSVSVTGLAGPDGDDRGNPVGTVFIGYAEKNNCFAKRFLFTGDREQVRLAAAREALQIVLEMNK